MMIHPVQHRIFYVRVNVILFQQPGFGSENIPEAR